MGSQLCHLGKVPQHLSLVLLCYETRGAEPLLTALQALGTHVRPWMSQLCLHTH